MDISPTYEQSCKAAKLEQSWSKAAAGVAWSLPVKLDKVFN